MNHSVYKTKLESDFAPLDFRSKHGDTKITEDKKRETYGSCQFLNRHSKTDFDVRTSQLCGQCDHFYRLETSDNSAYSALYI